MFVAVGLVGAVLLVLFLLLDDVLEGLLPDNDWISGPAIGAFLAVFGLFGWVAQEAFDAPTPVAAAAGIAGGVGLGWFTVRLSKALYHSPTDATPNTASLVGQPARVVTPVRAGGTGEVLVRLGGQPVKLSATSTDELPVGADSVVIAVQSSTRVVVEAATRFWGDTPSTDN
jgi:NfeD-like C-terminal, partner-binding